MSGASHDLAEMAAALGWRPCGECEVFTFYMNGDGLWCIMSQYVGPPPEWAAAEWGRQPAARRAGPFRKLNHFTFGLDVIDEIVYANALRCAAEWVAKHAPRVSVTGEAAG